MVLFHKTLIDAEKALKANDRTAAFEILQQHKEAELTEENYIKSSLYAIHLYLQNYITHLEQAIGLLSKESPSEKEVATAREHMARCIDNIREFEEGTKGLLQREGSILE
jgi:hypothetical protein